MYFSLGPTKQICKIANFQQNVQFSANFAKHPRFCTTLLSHTTLLKALRGKFSPKLSSVKQNPQLKIHDSCEIRCLKSNFHHLKDVCIEMHNISQILLAPSPYFCKCLFCKAPLCVSQYTVSIMIWR